MRSLSRWPWVFVLLLAGCSDQSDRSLKSLTPAPLPSMPTEPSQASHGLSPEERELLHNVKPAPVFGEAIPSKAVRIQLAGAQASFGGKSYDVDRPEQARALVQAVGDTPVLVAFDADTYLAQASGLFAALDDGQRETWLLHPEGAVAFPLTLRDEPAFRAWLDEPKPGKIRVIVREDGYELTTNVGKLPGGDPNGPSVPVRGGRLDVLGLRTGMELLRGRFKDAKDACIVPSFGTELSKVGASLSGFYRAQGEPIFPETCLVYPRPSTRIDGGTR